MDKEKLNNELKKLFSELSLSELEQLHDRLTKIIKDAKEKLVGDNNG